MRFRTQGCVLMDMDGNTIFSLSGSPNWLIYLARKNPKIMEEGPTSHLPNFVSLSPILISQYNPWSKRYRTWQHFFLYIIFHFWFGKFISPEILILTYIYLLSFDCNFFYIWTPRFLQIMDSESWEYKNVTRCVK